MSDEIMESQYYQSRSLLTETECFPRAVDPGWTAIFYFIGSLYMFLALAIICDEFFVPSLEQITLRLAISNDVAGATLMAAGGSAPELFTSAIGTFKDSDIGFAAIVGSAVFNVLFVIGVCAFSSPKPLELTWWPLFRDCTYYAMTLSILAVFFLPISKQEMEWFESLILFILYFVYVVVMKYNQKMYGVITRKFKGAPSGPDGEANADSTNAARPSAARPSALAQIGPDGEVEEVNEEMRASLMGIRETELYRYGFRAGMMNILLKDQWDYKDVASITVVQSICGDVRETFDELDVDKNGFLDIGELAALLQGLDADVTRHPIEDLMAELDTNNDGKICFDEFSIWYIQSQQRIIGSMKAIFEDVDEDKDGVLDMSEMKTFLEVIGVKDASPEQMAAILCQYHSDKVDDEKVGEENEEKQDDAQSAKEVAVEHNGNANANGRGLSFEEFRAWFVTTPYYESKCAAFRAQAECLEEMDSMMEWPSSWSGRFWFVVTLPLIVLFVVTVPDTRHPDKAKWCWLSFAMSILWIGFFSFWMVEWTQVLGDTLQIPMVVMGLTFLAGGTSVPDLLSSVIVAKQGYGDMAVSSSIGSNIFDVTVGLPFPWLLYTAYHGGRSVKVAADGLVQSILILLGMLILIVVIIAANKWKMTKLLGALFMLFYAGFVAQQLAVADWVC